MTLFLVASSGSAPAASPARPAPAATVIRRKELTPHAPPRAAQPRRRPVLALTLPLLAACTDNDPTAGDGGATANPRALTVQATDTECDALRGRPPRRAT